MSLDKAEFKLAVDQLRLRMFNECGEPTSYADVEDAYRLYEVGPAFLVAVDCGYDEAGAALLWSYGSGWRPLEGIDPTEVLDEET